MISNTEIFIILIYNASFYINACIWTRGAVLKYKGFLSVAIELWIIAIATTCVVAWLMGARL